MKKKTKLSKEWLFVHLQLDRFLRCVNDMNSGKYEKQETNSIVPTTERIIKYFKKAK